MTTKPLLHPSTDASLRILLKNPPHALLLSGVPGVGKSTVALWLTAELLQTTPQKLTNHPYVLQLSPEDGKAIGIEAIRELERMISLKVPGKHDISRVLIIHDAAMLTTEAQNALLKTLEEPPVGTVIILTASQSDALLPTIRSRLQSIEVIAPPASALQAELSGVSPEKQKQIMALSGGLPGLAFALAEDNTEHPLVIAATTARQLLTQSSFERLCSVDKLVKDKQNTSNVLYMLMQMSRAALMSSKSQRWQQVLKASYDADVNLRQGGQAKLVLTNLMLSL
jgi:DNA polymerase III subunit delta'